MSIPTAEFKSALLEAVPRIRRYCYALTGSISDADDLLQSTLEKALAKWQQYEPHSKIDRWLYRISRNHWIDQARRNKVQGEHVSFEESNDIAVHSEQVVTGNLTLTRVQTGMLSLSENLRTVLYLVGVEGLSYQEVAAQLNIPIGTVMSRLARARGQLAEHIELN